MAYQLVKIRAKGIVKNKEEVHCLIWEKGNLPPKKTIIWWFKQFFEGKQWKILSNKKHER